jgi:hypothetical protein
MCRGCLFVQVDVESGGDIDGCFKQDIIEELTKLVLQIVEATV